MRIGRPVVQISCVQLFHITPSPADNSWYCILRSYVKRSYYRVSPAPQRPTSDPIDQDTTKNLHHEFMIITDRTEDGIMEHMPGDVFNDSVVSVEDGLGLEGGGGGRGGLHVPQTH